MQVVYQASYLWGYWLRKKWKADILRFHQRAYGETLDAKYLESGNFYISKLCSVSFNLLHKTKQRVVMIPE